MKSAYSHESLKNLKSLEAYKHFVAGWVKQVLVHKNSAGIYLVLGKVVHSQHLSETPQSPWFAAQPSGTILCGHCTCMAGLGETCSHVTSVMFAVETAVKMKNDTTSTSVSCSWQAPSQTQNVEYSRSSDMDLTSPPAKKRKCAGESVTSVTPGEQELQPPQDYTDFYRKLHFSGVKPVVLSVLPDYCEEFVPKTVKLGLPKPMSSVFMETHVSKSLDELTAEASTDDSQISAVKQMTREQSTTKSRFLNRAGRITASNFKAASRTEIENPSNSLIQRVCYPDTFKFTTEATRYGCSHEWKVRKDYEMITKPKQRDMKVTESGIYIHKEFPYLDSTIESAVQDKNVCIESVDGHFGWKADHTYSYQIECQPGVTGRCYQDRSLLTDATVENLHLEKHYPPDVKQEELEMLYIKQEAEPETRGIKEEQEDEICKFPRTVSVESEEDNGPSQASKLASSSLFQHLPTRGEGRSPPDDLLKPLSDSDDLTSHSSDFNTDEEDVDFNASKSLNKSSLQRHTKEYSGGKPLSCSHCDKTFTTKEYLMKHMYTHTGGKPFLCTFCGKRFNRRGNLNRHTKKHTGEKPHVCSFCDKGFIEKQGLIRHASTHSGLKPFVCTSCGKRFREKRDLNNHTITHTGEKPFVCSPCNKTFVSKRALINHTSTHNGEKPFFCTLCGKRFTQKGSLNVHKRTHAGEKPFVCSLCDKRFFSKNELTRHACKHTGEKPYVCTLCDKRYRMKHELTRHACIHAK
ncbi:zinc finger protein 613-like isoform X2 [Corythoichthys intestinalis]|uniref:zinc finger protein 613-like isoform X2 n=1 Tax=Corythoichthys intestinalis TaxID=161448 RepID=UPI0025A67C53|nr:zinc finger protein 613-like isoform X2 [Corythoichthys intestinalis]